LKLTTKSQIEFGQARCKLIVVQLQIVIPSASLAANLLLAVVFQPAISLFLNCVNIPTPNQYNNKNENPGIKKKSKISNPFGMLN